MTNDLKSRVIDHVPHIHEPIKLWTAQHFTITDEYYEEIGISSVDGCYISLLLIMLPLVLESPESLNTTGEWLSTLCNRLSGVNV